MRRYETVTIIDPDLSEEGRQPILDRVDTLIGEHGGLLVETNVWGTRKLAYEIRKKPRGYYILIDYCGDTTLVNEIERYYRITEGVLKYMTVLLDEEVDVEALRAKLAAEAEPEPEPEPETESKSEAEPESAPQDGSQESDAAPAAEPAAPETPAADGDGEKE